MKVFVTGATGFIGSVLVQELLSHGHQVVGLARSDTSAQKLTKQGAEVLRGDLEDLEALTKGASSCDGVAHLGFIHDFSRFQKSIDIETAAIKAMTSAMKGTNKPFVATFATLNLPSDHFAVESDQQPRTPPWGLRSALQSLVLSQVDNGVAAMAIRLPPSVHGVGDAAFTPALISFARKTGKSLYIGDGQTRWCSVHKNDAAKLYRLALEKPVPGATLHAVHESGVTMKDIATTIGECLKIPVESVATGSEEEHAHYGHYGGVASTDNPVSSEYTQKTFGWTPTEKGLLDDLKEGHYFAEGSGSFLA